ncbi:unnamed protein product [Polarella glacialis]|uniref:Uncharacterized protein n=1 Tax=Polarella glacialis TaxID=89957 RepID=A0A813G916_POLGL|nr:unnamed protein product [Polarella glacialis]
MERATEDGTPEKPFRSLPRARQRVIPQLLLDWPASGDSSSSSCQSWKRSGDTLQKMDQLCGVSELSLERPADRRSLQFSLVPTGDGSQSQICERPRPRKTQLLGCSAQYKRVAINVLSQEDRLLNRGLLRPSPGYDSSDPWLHDSTKQLAKMLRPGAPVCFIGTGEAGSYYGPLPGSGDLHFVRHLSSLLLIPLASDAFMPLPTRAPRTGEWAVFAGIKTGPQVELNGLPCFVGPQGMPMLTDCSSAASAYKTWYWVTFRRPGKSRGPSFDSGDGQLSTSPGDMTLAFLGNLAALPGPPPGAPAAPLDSQCAPPSAFPPLAETPEEEQALLLARARTLQLLSEAAADPEAFSLEDSVQLALRGPDGPPEAEVRAQASRQATGDAGKTMKATSATSTASSTQCEKDPAESVDRPAFAWLGSSDDVGNSGSAGVVDGTVDASGDVPEETEPEDSPLQSSPVASRPRRLCRSLFLKAAELAVRKRPLSRFFGEEQHKVSLVPDASASASADFGTGLVLSWAEASEIRALRLGFCFVPSPKERRERGTDCLTDGHGADSANDSFDADAASDARDGKKAKQKAVLRDGLRRYFERKRQQRMEVSTKQADRLWKPPSRRKPRLQSSLSRQPQIDEGPLILCNGVILLKPPSDRDSKVKESLTDLQQAVKESRKDFAEGSCTEEETSSFEAEKDFACQDINSMCVMGADVMTETSQEDAQDADVWPARKRRRHLGRCWWAQDDFEAPWNRDAAERESAASVLTQAMLSHSFVGQEEPGRVAERRRLRPARFRVEGKQRSKIDPKNQCGSAPCQAH